jgi:ABC-type Mn2+/Zn2+ transport system permease subunit
MIMNMPTSELYGIILPIFGAAAAGLVGSFALMKKTILAGDVMSHIAIPGLGLAIIWKINPLIGGGLTLLVGIILIWMLQRKTELSAEAAIGVLFASSVALGALLINSSEALVDALFGGFGTVSTGEFVFGITVSIGIVVALWLLRNKLIITLFSPELAQSAGINVDAVNLWFLLLFGLAILVSLRFLGALLVGSLIIIPASAARQLTHTLSKFLVASVALSMLSVVIGFAIAHVYGLEPGATVVVTAAGFFVLSLLKKKD